MQRCLIVSTWNCVAGAAKHSLHDAEISVVSVLFGERLRYVSSPLIETALLQFGLVVVCGTKILS